MTTGVLGLSALDAFLFWDRMGFPPVPFVRRAMVESALARGDREQAEQYLRDWGVHPDSAPAAEAEDMLRGLFQEAGE